MARADSWKIRALHEAQTYREEGLPSSFITLTYSDETLPTDYGLQIGDLQKFLKRLRKRRAFRYLAVGEYGDLNKRPHYHALLFGVDFADDRLEMKRTPHGTLFLSAELESTWKLGHTSVADLTAETAGYVARYALKKINGPNAERAYTRTAHGHEWTVAKEFLTASNRPHGLGYRWLQKYGRSDVWHRRAVMIRGKKHLVPKFYERMHEKQAPEEIEQIREERALKARQTVITGEQRQAAEYNLRVRTKTRNL